jgi:NADH-quinone oxidoreductase subunit N
MAAATKAAAFAAVVRIFVSSMNVLRWDWRPVMAALSVLTVVFASVIAIAQTDLKRMLAYSSVAHAGFLGIAVVASSRTGVAAVILYLIVYTAQTMGAFGCLMLFKEGEGERVHLAKYSGLGSRHPAAAALFAFFLFSLAGIPPTGGFFGKFYVFVGAIGSGYAWLAVVGVLASVVAAFFYVRVAVVMFMQEADPADEMPLERSAGLRLALGVCAATLVAVALAPGFFIALAEKAVSFA